MAVREEIGITLVATIVWLWWPKQFSHKIIHKGGEREREREREREEGLWSPLNEIFNI